MTSPIAWMVVVGLAFCAFMGGVGYVRWWLERRRLIRAAERRALLIEEATPKRSMEPK